MNNNSDWKIGQLVSVQARTWAGINQPGGIARIQSIHHTTKSTNRSNTAAITSTSVGVKYVVDGRQEAAVQVRYITPHSFGRGRGLRNRGLLLGRCARCGSLRTDCGSCESNWTRKQASTHTTSATSEVEKSESAPQKSKADNVAEASQRMDDSDQEDDDDNSSLDLEQLVAEHAKAYRRYKRNQAKLALLFGDDTPNLKNHTLTQESGNAAHESVWAIRKRRKGRSSNNHIPKQRRRKTDGFLAEATGGVLASEKGDDVIDITHRSSSDSEPEHDRVNGSVGIVATQDVGDVDTTDNSDDSMALDRPMRSVAAPQPHEMPVDLTNDGDRFFGYRDGDDDVEGETFVQPEGTAETLPMDVQNQTKDISIEDLPSFVTRTLDRIATAIEQEYNVKVLQMEATNDSTIADWDRLHDAVIQDLIRNGLDQCRLALRRIRSGILLEFRYDSMSEAVETLMSRIREHKRKEQVESDVSSVASIEGWAEDDVTPPLSPGHSDALDNPSGEENTLNAFEAHPFASKRKKPVIKQVAFAKAKEQRVKNPSARRGELSKFPCSKDMGYASLHTLNLDGGSESDVEQSDVEPLNDTSAFNFTDTITHDPINPRKGQHRKHRKRTKKGQFREYLVPRPDNGPMTRPKESVEDKMEKWIACNAENVSEAEAIDNELDRPSRLRDDLFRELVNTNSANQKHRSNRTSGSPSLTSRQTTRTEAVNMCVLEDLTPANENGFLAQSSCTLEGVLTAMKNDGFRTLQDHVSSNSSGLNMCVATLVSALHLIKRRCSTDEPSESSCRVYKVFDDSSGLAFLEAVALQAIDTTMSLFNPLAWSLENVNTRTPLPALTALWKAVALNTDCVELFARCTLKNQFAQEWRLVRNGGHAFLSCVDPADWKALILTGKAFPAPKETRIAKFKGTLPRCEVNYMWGMFAYLSLIDVSTNKNESQSSRWELISLLFTRSSLAADDTLPPSVDQLHAALDDLTSLSKLFVKGMLGCLPKRDNFLVTLFDKVIGLEAEYLEDGDATDWNRFCVATELRTDVLTRIVLQGLEASNFRGTVSFNDAILQICGTECVTYMDSPLFMPSSCLLRLCLGILASWRSRLPCDKPKRHLFFEKAARVMTEAVAAKRRKFTQSEEKPVTPGDSFLDAFLVAEAKSCDMKSSHVHILEAQAFIVLFSSLPMGYECLAFDGIGFLDRLWSILTENDTLNDQASLRCNSSARLDVTIKVFLFLVLAFSERKAVAKLWPVLALPATLFQPIAGDIRDGVHALFLEKLISKLSSCLHCAIRPSIDMATTGRVVGRTIVALQCLWGRFREYGLDDSIISLLQQKFPLDKLHLLICKVVQHTVDGLYEEMALKGVLSLTRLLASIHSPVTFMQSDMMMDRDTSATNNLLGYTRLVSLLSSCVEQSQPSIRFDSSGSNTKFSPALSISGMGMVSRYVKEIVSCIVEIIIAGKSAIPSMLVSWMKNLGSDCSTYENNDREYKRRVSCHFAREIMCHTKADPSITGRVMNDGKNGFLFCFFDTILDVKLLQKIPSMSIDEIGSRSGSAIEATAFSDLRAFSKNSSKSLCAKLASIRSYAKGLSLGFASCGDVRLASALGDFSVSGASHRPKSLEHELSDRFQLMCMLLQVSLSRDSFLEHPCISCRLLGICCESLHSIFEKLQILDKTGEEIEGDTYRRSKLFQALSCFVELTIGLFGVICQGCTFSSPENDEKLTKLIYHLCDCLILPICQRKPVDLKVSLQKAVCLSFSDDIANNSDKQSHAGDHSTELYVDLFRTSFVRWSKQFLIGIAGCTILMRSNLLASLMSGASDQPNSEVFFRELSNRDVQQNNGAPLYQSMRQACIELEQKQPLFDSTIEAFKNLRQHILELHVLPMLKSQSPGQYLVFLVGLTDSCVDRPPLKLGTLCSVLRALILVARKAIQEGPSTLLCAAIACVLSIAKIPAACVNCQATGWLLDWTQNGATDDEEYFWLSFQYHEALYRTLLEITHEEQLPRFDVDDVWSLIGVDGRMGSEKVGRLRDLESARYGSIAHVKNVYRKNTRETAVVPLCTNLAYKRDEFKRLSLQVTELFRIAQSSL